MNILLTGGTGFIGKPLACALLDKGYKVHILTRSITRAKTRFADTLKQSPRNLTFFTQLSDLGKTTHFDAVINLAGESLIGRPWTTAYKHKIWNSRVQLTLDIAQWIRESASPPKVFISGSGAGYYGDHKEATVYEETKGRAGFIHELCRHWEQAALSVTRYGCRVCCLRMGIVLADDGGFVQQLRPMCRLGAGILFGSGRQWQPWIHRDDLIQIILTALTDEAYFSAINAVSLTPCTHKELSQSIGRRWGQPFWIRLPRWLVKPLFGEMSQLFYSSTKASPNRLTGFGYRYRYPELGEALDAIFPERGKVSAP